MQNGKDLYSLLKHKHKDLTKLACILAKMPIYEDVHPFLSSKTGMIMLANWLTRTNDKSIIKAMHVLVLLLTAITSYTQCPEDVQAEYKATYKLCLEAIYFWRKYLGH
mmetsp:Transcript_5679/g.16770  ORF Transcript_5679/g.16770 Transcript_5679/m.16770 type:complete len:108 (-) Transcript_5679:209-532(-)